MIAFDQHAHLLSANVAACALSGYSQPELRRMTLQRLADGCDAAQKPWRQFQRDGHLEGRYRLRRKTGEVIFVECVADANVLPGIHVGALATRRLLRAFVVQPNS